MRARFHAFVSGIVQGVLFRAFVRSEAERLGVKGFARNTPGGGVEVVAEAEKHALEMLLEEIRRGPPRARVDRVEVKWEDTENGFTGFSVMH